MPFPVADITRLTAVAATSFGVGKVVSEVIKNNVTSATRLDSIQIKVGSAALSLVVAGAAVTHVEEMTSSVIEKIRAIQAARHTTPY